MNTAPKRFQGARAEDVPEGIRTLFDAGKSLYIHGDVGLGKTHFAYGLAASREGSLVCNTTELLSEMRQDINRSAQDKRNWDHHLMKSPALVVLDDVGSEKLSDWVVEAFYLIINKRYLDMLPTIITSNHSIGELAQRIGDRTASRIAEMCEVIELKGEDRRLTDNKKITINV